MGDVMWPTPPADDAAIGVSSAELVDRFFGVAHRLRRASARSLVPLGLTPAQERALRLVARAPGPARMGELAARMGIVPRSATSLIGALEDAGLVGRAIDPDNRRSILVSLTDQGRAVQQDMNDARREAGDVLFSALSLTERTQLAALLDKVGTDRGHREDVGRSAAESPAVVSESDG